MDSDHMDQDLRIETADRQTSPEAALALMAKAAFASNDQLD